jgi:hypothetical protein
VWKKCILHLNASSVRFFVRRGTAPVRVPVFVICLAGLKAKPDANHANAHPINDWSCQICNQHRATSPARGPGFKPDTTRTNHARPDVTGSTIDFQFSVNEKRLRGRQPATNVPLAAPVKPTESIKPAPTVREARLQREATRRKLGRSITPPGDAGHSHSHSIGV